MKKEEIVNDVKSFQEFVRYNNAESTAINYGNAVYSFLSAFPNISRSCDISTQEIIHYLLSKFPNLSTRRNAHSALKLYYKFKSKRGESTKFKYIDYPEKPDTIPDHVTMDDFIKIFSVCENLKHLCIVLLAFDCGLRVSEIIKLRIKDIDSKLMNVNVRQAKGRKDRILKLTQFTLDKLREYFIEYKPIEYLFNGQKKEQYTIRSCQQLFSDLCKKANVKHYKFHALRHGMAMMLYETGGYSLETIRDLLGHKTVETTQIYARKNNNVIQRTLSPVELLLAKNNTSSPQTLFGSEINTQKQISP